MQKLRLNTTGRFLIYVACLVVAIALLVFASGKVRTTPRRAQPVAYEQAYEQMMERAIAYDIDYDMDKARVEKTIEHYGEGMEDIVEDAIENNVNNPDAKATAENSTRQQSDLDKKLPESMGKKFSESDLKKMK